MKNLLLMLLFCFSCNASFAQFTGLEGRWLGDNDEFMFIADSTKPDPDFSGSGFSISAYSVGRGSGGVHEVVCKGDTLSFLAWDDDLKPKEPYDLRIIKQTDTTLVMLPASEASRELFSGKDTLRFRRYRRRLDPNFKFEKIIFMVEGCYGRFGACYYSQLDSTGWFKFYESDDFRTTDTGYFVGQVKDSLYKELLLAIQDANLEKLQMSKEVCFDCPVNTLIIYHNGKRKAFETMMMIRPPIMAGLFRIIDELRLRTWYKKTAKFELER